MIKKLLYSLILFPLPLFSMSGNVNHAINNIIKKYSVRIEPKLQNLFDKMHLNYPPKKIALLAFKKEKKIELWAKNMNKTWYYIRTYPLTAYSGHLGPKLYEQDGQIPEGIYNLVSFNPFSSMHLSMMIDYPNYFDQLQAKKERRYHLGNNIFLHGKASSVGCLAVGDNAIEELFLLVHRVGLSGVKLIIAPNDLRKHKPATNYVENPRWLPELYRNISYALNQFKVMRY